LFFKDRSNNNNANINDDELNEEIGGYQLPLSLTPRASSLTSHPVSTTNVIQHLSDSSLQHNVVLHSNINESSTSSSPNRFDLNILNDKDDNKLAKRQTNSLMTVFEQGSTNDLLVDDTWHLRSSASVDDTTNKRTTDEKQMV